MSVGWIEFSSTSTRTTTRMKFYSFIVLVLLLVLVLGCFPILLHYCKGIEQ
jgi:hypothetical protein